MAREAQEGMLAELRRDWHGLTDMWVRFSAIASEIPFVWDFEPKRGGMVLRPHQHGGRVLSDAGGDRR